MIILGNGTSPKKINPNLLTSFPKIGCNATQGLFCRLFVCCDKKMVKQVLAS